MTQVILLAIALAMDAFAVSIGLGAKQSTVVSSDTTKSNTHSQSVINRAILVLALLSGLYFGIAQGIMPLIGYLLGSAIIGWLASAAPWIGGIILVGLGIKMLYEAFSGCPDKLLPDELLSGEPNKGSENNVRTITTDHKLMLSLAIATSIDALAAGFTLNLLDMNAWLACFIIAIITAMFCVVGTYLGFKSGTWLEDKAEILGGVVLIGIGVNMVL